MILLVKGTIVAARVAVNRPSDHRPNWTNPPQWRWCSQLQDLLKLKSARGPHPPSHMP